MPLSLHDLETAVAGAKIGRPLERYPPLSTVSALSNWCKKAVRFSLPRQASR
jgi:hypothetical protein